jgi:BirA family biotin operon repressor/biotin-[acetyl-CoA-carboxylase] ligase
MAIEDLTLRVHRYERVASTMDVVHELADSGAPAGTVVVAGEQLEGRGSRGRPWHSPPGGVWMSMLFRPGSAAALEVISLRAGLSVARTLDRFLSTSLRLKWPNDIMLGDRKVGGILCEARWQGAALGWVAVGLGLNLQNRLPPELRGTAGSLGDERPDLQPDDLLEPLVTALRHLDLETERLSSAELSQFATRSWLNGREIREPLRGTVAGVGDDGTLRVQTPEGSQVVLRSGSVQLSALLPR